ncbi:hypothetical protein QMK33_06050 [Hymenobacter sp. H14-R3]|uniref:hypothetical protein n=1 Tax=Hymenobacter sp. H14-R3 TaxID=3046308 RepID=UPI0024B99A63|nr:hypothetical protein [Hymenobacter sp. H14-R3]MDJ0364708.1 hypothetical protein [Hymenobacter sp. H14-R3]
MTDITTAAEVYTLLGDELWDYLPIEEGRILLRIERSEGAQGYKGIYMDDNGSAESLAVLPSNKSKAVEQLYQLTSQGGKNPWNLLYFTLLPGRAFEVDFLLDEDARAMLSFLAHSHGMAARRRDAAYAALMAEQARTQAARIFTQCSQRLAALGASEQPGWQRLLVEASHWNGGTFELRGFVYAAPVPGAAGEPPQEAGEAFSVVQDWELVKQFYEFNTNLYQPMWNTLAWTVWPDGTYTLVFDWDTQKEVYTKRPTHLVFPYTRQGRWQEPA